MPNNSPLYNNETAPPEEGMKLYHCMYPAVVEGLELKKELHDIAAVSTEEAVAHAIKSCNIDPIEAESLVNRITEAVEKSGFECLEYTDFPIVMRELRWARPEDVPQDDPRFHEVELKFICGDDDEPIRGENA